MNAKELIDVLLNNITEEDRDNSNVEFWFEEQEFEVENISGFGMSPDLIIRLKKIDSPIMKTATFKKSIVGEVKQRFNEVIEDINKE
jgi:hypothetical protein